MTNYSTECSFISYFIQSVISQKEKKKEMNDSFAICRKFTNSTKFTKSAYHAHGTIGLPYMCGFGIFGWPLSRVYIQAA